jgi:hypothetical protein
VMNSRRYRTDPKLRRRGIEWSGTAIIELSSKPVQLLTSGIFESIRDTIPGDRARGRRWCIASAADHSVMEN